MGDVSEANLHPIHTRLGRTALKWSAQDLADHADVGIATLWRFEAGDNVRASSKRALIDALERGGVVLLNGNSPGVRLPANDTEARDCA